MPKLVLVLLLASTGARAEQVIVQHGEIDVIQEAGIEQVWQTAPVVFETCWDMRGWVQEGWSLRYILLSTVQIVP